MPIHVNTITNELDVEAQQPDRESPAPRPWDDAMRFAVRLSQAGVRRARLAARDADG